MLDLKKKYLKLLVKQEVVGQKFSNKLSQLNDFYLPICDKLFNDFKTLRRTFIIGLSGGQGSGKSTIAQILKLIIENRFQLNVVCFSIDDFYKTLPEREKLSKAIHPLFRTRGVPGTHDCKLILKVIKNLTKKKFKVVNIPKFNKSIDNRSEKKNWQKIKKKPDIIIFEGWCVGAKCQSNRELKRPINILEKLEDSKLTWRKKVNNELKTNYKKIYNLIDKKIYLKIPSFKYVLKWRFLQEKKLKFSAKNKKNIMSKKKIKKFIMFYERITKKMIKDYKTNDIVVFLDKKHKIKSIKV